MYITKEFLNSIEHSTLIKINNNCRFYFLEENLEEHNPIPYYYANYDLSINSYISFKWSLYGFFFYKELMKNLDDSSIVERMSFEESLNSDLLNLNNKKNKIFTFDKEIITNNLQFKTLIEDFYVEFKYTENTMVEFKLKLNVSEFILLQNDLFPRLSA